MTTRRQNLARADVAALPFEDTGFDLAVTSFSAHHRFETGSAGTDGALAVFEASETSTFRGIGPGRWHGAWSSGSPADQARAPPIWGDCPRGPILRP